MKTLLVVLLFVVIGGAVGWQRYQRAQNPTIAERASAEAEKSAVAAMEPRRVDAAARAAWHLTPDAVSEELARTGQVVRERVVAVGEAADDVRIETVIKGKLDDASELSALDVTVDCADGAVKLSGATASPAQVAQAVGLALETTGVRRVVAELAVKS